MSDEFVTMYHGDTGNVSEQTSRLAFEQVWQHRGWTLLDGDDLSGITKDDLEKIAIDRGADISKAKTKADIADALKGASNG